jgi:branched-chain amino acid transport system permease protein
VSLALQIVVSGLAAGTVYGIVACGHALVHQLTGVINFAFGDLIALGVFIALLALGGTGAVTADAPPGRLTVAVVVGVLAAAAGGLLTYVFAVEPFLGEVSPLGWVGASVAVAFVIHNALRAFFPHASYVFPDPIAFDRVGTNGTFDVGGASVSVRALFVTAVALVLAVLAGLALQRSRAGKALRAITDDAEAAATVGIPVRRLVALTFAASGALAALAAIAAAPQAPFDTDAGTLLGVKGLAAAAIVGFGEPWQAFAAGVGVGIAEAAIASGTVGGHGLGPAWSVVLPLGAALAALAVRSLRAPALEAG